MLNPTTTLRRIREHQPCTLGWERGLKALGPDLDAPISLGDIATSNNAADALWCVRAMDWDDIAVRRAVVGGAVLPAAKRALAYTSNQRVHQQAVDALVQWVAGDDSVNLDAAAEATWAAKAPGTAAEAMAVAVWATGAAAATSAVGAAWSTAIAGWATGAAAERDRRRADIIAAFPCIRLRGV